MAETSFPIKNQPLDDRQWGQVVEGFGSGILARGSESYGIPGGTIDNASNTVKLGGLSPITKDGRAVVSGYLHRYDSAITLSVPAVTTATTYYIGLTYDSRLHDAAGGPVKVTVTKEVPSGEYVTYLPIYEIRRAANQLLSDATITDKRAFVAPQITVKGSVALPPASSVLTYTTAKDFTTGQEWQMSMAGKWEPMGAYTVPVPNNATWDRGGASIVVTPLSDGRSMYSLEVEMIRTGGSYTIGTDFGANGQIVPAVARGSRGVIYAQAMIGRFPGVAAINTTTGELMTRVYSGTAPVNTGMRLTFQTFWVA